ncbi:hypothetical protein PF004_g26477 [Phytophthora fragariae]|uniref:Secreted protein n=1 Tax=Phytophthora fragariae TaxID=53985 RepID=A0A6G0MQ28_9STRA|nr:hypothetical protein PF004_g26477 [Phytophthora fragariae]
MPSLRLIVSHSLFFIASAMSSVRHRLLRLTWRSTVSALLSWTGWRRAITNLVLLEQVPQNGIPAVPVVVPDLVARLLLPLSHYIAKACTSHSINVRNCLATHRYTQ